ncbi:MAG: winged helix-turn-helix domain-containing protein [Gordonibacter sp.]
MGAISDEDVSAVVCEGVAGFLDSENEAIAALEASELSDQAKWQIAALLQQPKQKFMLVVEAVNANLPAFEYAYAKIEAEIAPLLTQLEDQVAQGELPPAVDTVRALDPDAQVVPSLASTLMIMLFGKYCFVGLLLSRLLAGQGEGLTEIEATLVAKSLSDASKLKILRVLKNEKRYNLEIARRVELTPATTSHHMNMLLAAGLVEMSKEDGKVYYGLCASGIKRYCAWLNDSLL